MFKYDSKYKFSKVTVILDGETVSFPEGQSIAAGLLGLGKIVSQISPSSKKTCSPFCLMGVCYECLMEIDGVRQQACMTEVKEGMVINRHLDKKKGDNI